MVSFKQHDQLLSSRSWLSSSPEHLFLARQRSSFLTVDNFFYKQPHTYRSCQETTPSCFYLLRKSIRPFPYTATDDFAAVKIHYIMVERPPLKCTHVNQGYEMIFLSFLFLSVSISRILDIYLQLHIDDSQRKFLKKNIVNSRMIINLRSGTTWILPLTHD